MIGGSPGQAMTLHLREGGQRDAVFHKAVVWDARQEGTANMSGLARAQESRRGSTRRSSGQLVRQ